MHPTLQARRWIVMTVVKRAAREWKMVSVNRVVVESERPCQVERVWTQLAQSFISVLLSSRRA